MEASACQPVETSLASSAAEIKDERCTWKGKTERHLHIYTSLFDKIGEKCICCANIDICL